MKWPTKNILQAVLLFALSISVCFAGSAESSAKQPKASDLQNTARVVHFPKDMSIGRVYLVEMPLPQDRLWHRALIWDNKSLGEARGDVTVPAGAILRLDVFGEVPKGRPFANLRPNDIQMMSLMTCRYVNDALIQDVSRLTGLEVLMLGESTITSKGLRYLTRLKMLKALAIPGYIRSQDMDFLRELPPLEYLHFGSPMVTDDKMPVIGTLTSLTQLSLGGSEVGQGLAQIKGLKSLRWLHLEANRSYDIDKHLAHIAGLTELEELDLSDTQIGDAGLAHLAGLTKLKKLHIRSNPATDRITNAGLAHLKDLKSLEEINLPYTRITDTGIECLTQIESLKKMNPYGNGITDKVIEKIAKMKSLENLGVRSDNITDAGMAQLAQFANLKSLDLNGCPVTNAGLASLTKMKTLDTLTISGTRINGEGLGALREFPDLAELNLLFMKLGDKRISCLTNLPKLKKIWLGYSDFGLSDEDLAHLGRITSLENLDIRLTGDHPSTVTNEGLKHLAALKNLTFLRLPGSMSVTDEGLKHLSNLTALEQVWVNNSPITDAGLKCFENMTSLNYLCITKSHITEKGEAQLEKKISGLYCNFSR